MKQDVVAVNPCTPRKFISGSQPSFPPLQSSGAREQAANAKRIFTRLYFHNENILHFV